MTKTLDALAVRNQINELFTDLPAEPEVRNWLDLRREIDKLVLEALLSAACKHDGGVDWETSLGEKRCGLCGRKIEKGE